MAGSYGHPDAGHDVVVSFDDGPHPKYTPQLLDLLAKENIKGLFFVCGERVATADGKAIVRRAATEGHLIGNHTYSHPNLTKLSAEQVRSEIVRTHELISEVEPKQKLFRPPYGAHNATVDAVLKELDYQIVLWNVDPEDWKAANQPAAWIDVALSQISHREHSMFLCHDIHASTVNNFAAFISRVRGLQVPRFLSYA